MKITYRAFGTDSDGDDVQQDLVVDAGTGPDIARSMFAEAWAGYGVELSRVELLENVDIVDYLSFGYRDREHATDYIRVIADDVNRAYYDGYDSLGYGSVAVEDGIEYHIQFCRSSDESGYTGVRQTDGSGWVVYGSSNSDGCRFPRDDRSNSRYDESELFVGFPVDGASGPIGLLRIGSSYVGYSVCEYDEQLFARGTDGSSVPLC
jgi:hypothetical protein